ncbi:hypothetical protein ACHAPJ_009934 [Fusarium lateritium]
MDKEFVKHTSAQSDGRAHHLEDGKDVQQAAAASTDEEHSMTLRDALRKCPRAVIWGMLVCLSIIMEGYQVGLVPGLWAQPAFRRKYGRQLPDGDWQLENKWQSLQQSLVNVGSLCGYIVSGEIIDRIGHKRTLYLCMTMVSGFIFVVFFAHTIEMLVVGETLLGIPWGIIQTLTTTYAAEITPIALRTYLTSYVCLCWTIGGFIGSGVLRGYAENTTHWAYRMPFAIQWIWPVPIMIIVAFAPDSPWWYARHNRLDEAREALLALRSSKDTEYNPDASLALICQTIEAEKKLDHNGSTYLACFRGIDLRRTEIASIAGAAPLFAGAGFCGSSVYFMSNAGLAPGPAYNLGMGQNALSICGVLLSWYLMHRCGRRTLYLWGISFVFTIQILVGILGVVSSTKESVLWATGAMMLLYQIPYVSTLGSPAYPVVAEIPSAHLRNKTVAVARFFLNALGIGGMFLNPALLNPGSWNLQAKGGFVWAGISGATLIWTYFRMPETKDRSFGEIDDLFARKISARKFASTQANVVASTEGID